jgi:hypothetical protein
MVSAPLAANARSLAGALSSAIGTWITANHQNRRDLLANQIARREALYSDFIEENARPMVEPWNTTPMIFKNDYRFTRC